MRQTVQTFSASVLLKIKIQNRASLDQKYPYRRYLESMGGIFMKKLAKSALLLLTAVLCLGLFTMTASAATTSKTTTKTTTKKVTMSSKAKKSRKVKKTKTKKTTKKTKKKNQQITKVTTVKTTTQTTYKKNSRVKTVKTTVRTNVKTTTKKVKASSKSTKKTVSAKKAVAGASSTDIYDLAPKAGSNVKSAFKKLGFQVKVNGGVSYSGYFSARDQSITLKRVNDDCIYHELGHFVAFVSGNSDKKAEFQSIYRAEKGKYKASDKNYVTSSASEYFAESYKNYVENPGALKASRPRTYAYIAKAAAAVTDSQAARLAAVYAPIWK